jgi:hypothetical protein
VLVKHLGNGVLLRPADDVWQSMETRLAALEPGFELQRHQPDQQVRPAITRICRQIGSSHDPAGTQHLQSLG